MLCGNKVTQTKGWLSYKMRAGKQGWYGAVVCCSKQEYAEIKYPLQKLNTLSANSSMTTTTTTKRSIIRVDNFN